MRISDWSSDVCSSDLLVADPLQAARLAGRGGGPLDGAQAVEEEVLHDGPRLRLPEWRVNRLLAVDLVVGLVERLVVGAQRRAELGEQEDRKSTRLNSSH